MNIFGREVGGGGNPKKPLQLVQRGTDTRIPIELVAQPSGEVLDLSRFERLSVKIFNDAGTDCATPPTDIQDNHLIVEVTADISQALGTGVYSVEVTGRVADTSFADGYHDYTIRTTLCRVTSDGSDATPTKVTASVIEGLKGKDGADAYEVAKKAGYTGSREEWLETLIGVPGKSAYQSYLDTTTDSPKLTEKEWATLNATTTQFLYRINKGKEAPMNEQTLSADQLMELDKHRRALIEALKVKGVGALDTDGLETLATKVRELEGTPHLIVYKSQQFIDWKDETLPPLKLSESYRPADLSYLVARNPFLRKLPTVQGIEQAARLSLYAESCSALTKVVLPDLDEARSVDSAFSGCTSITTATIGAMLKVTDMSWLLGGCRSLTTATIGATPKVTTVSRAFHDCRALKSVTLDFSGGEFTDASYLFNECNKLRTVTGTLDFTSTTNVYGTFHNCYLLEEVRVKGLKVSLELYDCANLSMDSVRYLVENAQTVKNQSIGLSRKLLEAHEEELGNLGDTASDKGFTFNYR